MSAFAFDAVAPTFDRHRALPAGVPEAVRAAVLRCAGLMRPRILDLGAGSGRIGLAFVTAGDDYVGVDLSSEMLTEFARRAALHGAAPRLVQANGERLPFLDAAFDAVLLIQVFGGLHGWQEFIAESRRVLRPSAAIIVGRTEMPRDGVDAQLKQRLAKILEEQGIEQDRTNTRDAVMHWLKANADRHESVTAAIWTARRTPRAFIERHGSGARFSALPPPVKTQALRKLGAWAEATFGSLDTTSSESHAFALQVFRFRDGNS